MDIVRYSKILKSIEPREIVLLKAFPCKWGICSFCSYIEDNSSNEAEMLELNSRILKQITGEFGVLEVINSGSCFEIPGKTLEAIKKIVESKKISKLYFEAHWSYRNRLQEFRDFFEVPIVFITGIETFDENFRNKILKKGIFFSDFEEIKNYFQSVCIMVGMQGQTREMIARDIDILLKNFEHGTVNLFTENNTSIKADPELQEWFKENYRWLENVDKIDVLWENTDFGVGANIDEK
ncbi:MAG: radical SAM protein [Candidatus Rifleibacteriota bacterium]